MKRFISVVMLASVLVVGMFTYAEAGRKAKDFQTFEKPIRVVTTQFTTVYDKYGGSIRGCNKGWTMKALGFSLINGRTYVKVEYDGVIFKDVGYVIPSRLRDDD
jgi:hypothetical protein